MPRWLRLTLAILFFLLGVIGLVVPVMPQLLFFAISAILVAPDFPPARRLVTWIFSRWPKLQRALPRWLRAVLSQGKKPAEIKPMFVLKDNTFAVDAKGKVLDRGQRTGDLRFSFLNRPVNIMLKMNRIMASRERG